MMISPPSGKDSNVQSSKKWEKNGIRMRLLILAKEQRLKSENSEENKMASFSDKASKNRVQLKK